MTNYVEKINDISIGGNNFDGQWTYKYQVAYQGFPTVNSTLTYNLASYLPDDNYDYEVLIGGYAYTGTTTNNVIQLKVNSGSTATHNSSCLLAHKVTRTNAFNEGGSSAVIPIQKSDQKISIYFVGTYRTTNNQTRVELFGYRRVGANSIGSRDYIEKIAIPSGEIIPIGGNIISSQWKPVGTSSFTGAIFNANYTARTTYTINLKSSNLIPNDGYKYELLMSTWANTGATSDNYCIIRFTSNLITGSLTVYGAVTKVAATNNNGVQVVYPVAEDGILKVNFSAPSGVSQSGRVWLHGYRRLGTNE